MSSALADGIGQAGPRPGTGDHILQVSDLSVDYATKQGNVRAVDNVSFDLRRGEFIGIVGESGCGKSTLVFAIAQLLSPPAGLTSGNVVFRGVSMVGMTDSQLAAIRWRDLSVVMQSAMNALNPVKSIASQYKDAMRAHGVRSKTEIADRSAHVLKMVGHRPRAPAQLSAPALGRHAPASHDRDGAAVHA